MSDNYTVTPISIDDKILMDLSSANPLLRLERNRDGNLVVMSPSGSKISNVQSKIISQLQHWNEKKVLGLIFDSQGGFKLPSGAVFAPDAACVSLDAWNRLSELQQEGFAQICPEFVVEVISPSDSLKQQQEKMLEWLENGVQLGFLIHPKDEKAWIYKPNSEPQFFEHFDQTISGEPILVGFELDLSKLKLI